MHPMNLRNESWWPCVEPLYRAGVTAGQLAMLFKASIRSMRRQMDAAGIHKGRGRPRLRPLTPPGLHRYKVQVAFLTPWPGREPRLDLSLIATDLLQLVCMFEDAPSDVQILDVCYQPPE